MQGAATSADDAPADDEDALLPAAEARAYAEALIRTGNQKTAAKLAWPDVAPKAAQIRGSRAGRDPRVQQYIAELTEAVKRDAQYTALEAMKEAGEILRSAAADRNWNACVRAAELRARISGLLVERVDLQVSDRGLSLREALAARDRWLANQRGEMLVEDAQIIAPALAAPTPFKAIDPAFAVEPIDVFS